MQSNAMSKQEESTNLADSAINFSVTSQKAGPKKVIAEAESSLHTCKQLRQAKRWSLFI